MSICYVYDNFFSNISNIKYINLYNFTNDRIISDIFNSNANQIYVCQKENIIYNPNAYNCCDSNFKVYECIIPAIPIPDSSDKNNPDTKNIDYPDTKIIDSTYAKLEPIITDSSNEEIPNLNNSPSSSGGISTGVIIGIIIGGVVFITAVVLAIVFFVRKKNKKIPQPRLDDSRKNITVIKTSENENNFPHEHEPGLKKADPILIFFESAEFGNIRLYIDFNKTIDELIRCYFNEIKRPELYRDKSFSFLVNGECLHFPYSNYSKAPVENLISKIDPFKTITIVVNHNKEETE